MYETYQNSVRTVIQMFADNTAGETASKKRLATTRLSDGRASLVGYGWLRLADYDESENHLTVYLGHKDLKSRTVTRWLNAVVEETEGRRNVILSDNAPTFGGPNDGADYINDYIGDFDGNSGVEQRAVDRVLRSLDIVDRFL